MTCEAVLWLEFGFGGARSLPTVGIRSKTHAALSKVMCFGHATAYLGEIIHPRHKHYERACNWLTGQQTGGQVTDGQGRHANFGCSLTLQDHTMGSIRQLLPSGQSVQLHIKQGFRRERGVRRDGEA